jgi:hypothetical protein
MGGCHLTIESSRQLPSESTITIRHTLHTRIGVYLFESL